MSEEEEPEEGTIVNFSFWLPLDLGNPLTKVMIRHHAVAMNIVWDDEEDLATVLTGLEYIINCAKRERAVRTEIQDIEGDLDELLNKRDEDCEDD